MPYAEKLPSGRYRALYRTPDGKKKAVKGTFAGKREAKNAAADAESSARSLDWRAAEARKRTWGEWCEEWWPTRDIESSTLKRQLTQRKKHIDPKWWDVPLEEFTRHDVRSWVLSLTREREDEPSWRPLSRSSAQKLGLMLSASFSAAVDKGIMNYNPAARLKISVAKVSNHRYLTRDEVTHLLTFVANPVDKAVVSTLFGAGLRWGEVNGLQVERVDVERLQIHVAEVWDSTGRRLKMYPKDEEQRYVPIPEWLAERLEPLVTGRRSGFVFEHEGFKLDYSNWRKKVWLRAIDLAGLAPLKIHEARHTYASWLIQSGFSLAEVGQLLGHADPSTTQIYAHLLDPNGPRVRSALPEV
ncbi:tyrosine recombinase XerC-like [Tenebrio molitor]|uniref:tyrosine recombinase XerC-like n=1 Tax=Tenebrio molitor TaxID=7067 RepID=UPI003624778A